MRTKAVKWAYTDVRSIDYSSYLDWSRKNPHCPWCNLTCDEDFDKEGPDTYPTLTTILECPKCGWWAAQQKTIEYMGGLGIRGGRRYVAAILKHFDPSHSAVGIEELRRYLTHNYSDNRAVTPRKMEELVRSVFQDFLQCEVHYFTNDTYAPDGGIDLVALEGDDGLVTAIQVKRRTRDIAESVCTIREFVGAMAVEGFRKGIFVTTGRYSKTAQRLPTRVKKVYGQKVALDLVDATGFEDLLRRTQTTSESHPWRRGIEKFEDEEPIPWDSFVKRMRG